MAPHKTFRTYGRGSNSSITSVEAFNILFAKNLTQRKLYPNSKKGKSGAKYEVKELPAQIKTMLSDESSLRVNMNDTFDKLLKKPLNYCNFDVNINNTSSLSVVSNIKISPMLQKLRSFSNKKTQNTINSWFNQPTLPGEQVTNSLEIDSIDSSNSIKNKSKSQRSLKTSRTSPIRLRSNNHNISPELSNFPQIFADSQKLCKEDSLNQYSGHTEDKTEKKFLRKGHKNEHKNSFLNPIYTHSKREHILIHCSTPVVSRRKQHLVEQTISPIQLQDNVKQCIVASLQEIESWSSLVPKFECIATQNHKSVNIHAESLKPLSFNLDEFEHFFDSMRLNSNELKQCKNKNINSKENFKMEDFEKFHKKLSKSQTTSQTKGISLKDFESFCEQYQTKYISKPDSFFDATKPKNFITHRKHKMSHFLQSSNIGKDCKLKDLVVVLDNNLFNLYRPKWYRSASRSKKTNTDKELIVNLRRLSIDKLKQPFSQKNSLTKAKCKIFNGSSVACRKFSSNWNKISQSLNATKDKNKKSGEIDVSQLIKIRSTSANTFSTSKSRNKLMFTSVNCKEPDNSDSEKENAASSVNISRRSLRERKTLVETERNNQINEDKEQLFSGKNKEYIAKIWSASDLDILEESHISKSITNSFISPLRIRKSVGCRKEYNGVADNYENTVDCTSSDAKQSSYIAHNLSSSVLLSTNANLTTSIVNLCDASSNSSTAQLMTANENSLFTSTYLRKSKARETSYLSKSTSLFGSKITGPIQKKLSNEYSLDQNTNQQERIVCNDLVKISPVHYHTRPKQFNLRTGKSWRRSFLQHKRESVLDLTQSCCGDIQTILELSEEIAQSPFNILPYEQSKCSTRKSILQKYAYSSSFAKDGSNKGSSRKFISKRLTGLSARDMILEHCGQTDCMPFEKMYPKSLLQDCVKIGEGVYGEVFLYSQENGKKSVMKVIPIEGSELVNGEKQKRFHEILSEIIIVSQLSNLRNDPTNQTSVFCEIQKISYVKGKYPKMLLNLWYTYDKAKGSENDSPNVFKCDQEYIVLNLTNGGKDLEAFEFNNASQAFSMFQQVAYALAIGEESLQFEHRDLHWGNILLRSVDRNKKVFFKYKGIVKECNAHGVEATIIDFTLSRIIHDGVVIFNDLGQDPELFLADGDYQFDIYRLMRQRNKSLLHSHTKEVWKNLLLRQNPKGESDKSAKNIKKSS